MTTNKETVQYRITAIVEVEVTDRILTNVWNMALDLPDSLSGAEWEDRPWLRELVIEPVPIVAIIKELPARLPRVSASRL